MIRPEINELVKLGRMPDASNDDISDELIDTYDSLLRKIKAPLSYDEAILLIKLFPENGLYGVEWTLLHLIESVYKTVSNDEYLNLIKLCPSKEWNEAMQIRFRNAQTKEEL